MMFFSLLIIKNCMTFVNFHFYLFWSAYGIDTAIFTWKFIFNIIQKIT